MSHLDPERLSLLAIGDPATVDERAHLDHCDECALELAELEYTVVVGRSTAQLGELESPPEEVWSGIREELGLRDTEAPTRAHRGRTRLLVALAAGVALVLAVVGVWSFVRPAPEPVPLAAAVLDAFPGHPDAIGEAVVLQDADGSREIRVTLDSSQPGDGFREVWLITADASALVSLGVLEGDEATLPVPDDIDLHDYVLVDVSLEPSDGDPGHSGDSIVRGELTFA